MKYAVTGGAGFIGSHLVKNLVERGNEIIVIDNLNTGKKKNVKKNFKKINFFEVDIRDFSTIEDIMKNVDGIFHEAALASVQDSFRIPDKFFDVNVKGTENIFKIGKKLGIKVVYASSSSVYGNPISIPIKENDDKNPINPYAKTKLENDKMAEKYAKNGLKVIGLRYFNVFGPGQSKEYAGVIKLFLERIQQGLSPLINGDGLQVRDFVYVDDVVNANMLAMESNIDGKFFNIGTGTTISVLDLANMIIKFSGLKLKPIHRLAVPGDVRATQADITKAKTMLKWKPTTSIQDWLKNAVLDVKNNL
ncbi:MAG: SDR family NAD(P)-dependent oxidoreductase [Pelagibacterales bacterium]|nr:SDR family NAD(P)-dependent oxidoreductase [Pelagibacterales bacterium]